MTDTPNLALPYIEGAQAQKHVTHNEALRMLDALVMLSVLDRDLTAPPGSPAEGDRYLVASPATGDFAGMEDRIANYADGGWLFHTPRAGWVCYVQDESALIAFDGAEWAAALDVIGGITELQNLTLLGVGTEADGTNPLSAKLNNALWSAKTAAEGGDGDLRYKLSKEGESNTLSFLFQDDFSGRAEIGLTGDDDFHVKVSDDGGSWLEAIVIDRATGEVSFPQTSIQGGREVLTANRTYYVRCDLGTCTISNASPAVVTRTAHGLQEDDPVVFKTDGALPTGLTPGAVYYVIAAGLTADAFEVSATPGGAAINTSSAGSGTHSVATGNDANDGLAQTRAGAFLSVAHAIATVYSLDLSIYDVTIELDDGQYASQALFSGRFVGKGAVTLKGSNATGVEFTAANCIQLIDYARVNVANMKLTPATLNCVVVQSGSNLTLEANIVFGAAAGTGRHVFAENGSTVSLTAAYSIVGGAFNHLYAQNLAIIRSTGAFTVTLTGTPAFTHFCRAKELSDIQSVAAFSGDATGQRYNVDLNAVVNTGGQGASYFPGDAAGATATGGQYQ